MVRIVKIVKIVKIVENCQNFQKFSRLLKMFDQVGVADPEEGSCDDPGRAGAARCDAVDDVC